MSKLDEKYILEALKRGIEREKLEEFRIIFTQDELDKYNLNKPSKKSRLGLGTGFNWSEKVNDELVNLLKKASPDIELTQADIDGIERDDAKLIKFARSISANTSNRALKQSIDNKIEQIFQSYTTSDASDGSIDDPELDAKVRDIDVEPKRISDKDAIQSISHPRVMVSDSTMAAGKFFGSQNDLINAIFNQSTIKDRCAAFTDVSNKVFDLTTDMDKNLTQNEMREVMQAIMFIDLCNSFFNEIDGRAVGYAFESLCAIICGGQVVGGGNGAADFKTNTDAEGSSKKYGSWSGITQAASGFSLTEAGKTKSLHYVIAVPEYTRMDKKTQPDETVQMTDKGAKVTKVRLYYIIVDLVKEIEDEDGKVGVFITKNGDSKHLAMQNVRIEGKPKQDINIILDADPADCFVGEFQVYGTGPRGKAESLRSLLGRQSKKSKTGVKGAFNAVRDYFTELLKAEEASKKYINIKNDSDPSEIIQQGNLALKTMTTADEKLVNVIKLLRPDDTDYSKKDRKLSENVVTDSKQLVDLISEIAENMLKDIDFE